MPNIDYKKNICKPFFVFPKGILQIFKPRPPFLLKKYKEFQKKVKFYRKVNTKIRTILHFKSLIQSKNFSQFFPFYDKNFKKKFKKNNLKQPLPFVKKFLQFYFRNIRFSNKFIYFYLKKLFLVQFSKFVIFSEISKWKNKEFKNKINFIFDINCTKNLIDFNFKI
jgi:hypothetical protein